MVGFHRRHDQCSVSIKIEFRHPHSPCQAHTSSISIFYSRIHAYTFLKRRIPLTFLLFQHGVISTPRCKTFTTCLHPWQDAVTINDMHPPRIIWMQIMFHLTIETASLNVANAVRVTGIMYLRPLDDRDKMHASAAYKYSANCMSFHILALFWPLLFSPLSLTHTWPALRSVE